MWQERIKKSQLRLLAAEFFAGRVPRDEYRARRRILIDNIVAGDEAIERVEGLLHDDDQAEAATLEISGEPLALGLSSTKRFPPPILLIAGAVLCAAALTVWLWPEPRPPAPKPTPPTVPLAASISRSRTLVESFVARRHYSAEAIDQFIRDWQKVDASEREFAHHQPWFESLVRALGDEVTTQQALSRLADGDAALDRAKAAFALGEFLGVSDKLPRVENMTAPRRASLATTFGTKTTNTPLIESTESAHTDATRNSVTPQSPMIDNGSSTAPPVGDVPFLVPAIPSAPRPTGLQWLAAQSDEQLTLQVFAVNHLDRVEQLISAHPNLPVYVLASEGRLPRYRVFLGVFSDPVQARQAYDALPTDVTAASQGAIVKSFSAVREDLRAPAPNTASANKLGAVHSPKQAPNQRPKPTEASAFTLQVFATSNRDNAQALVQAFPTLKLQLREISGNDAPFRVIYGDFSSAKDARAAAAALPQTLLERTGIPLLKLTRSFDTAQ